MRGCLALQLRNQSVAPGWQGIEPCPECVERTWRRLARENQEGRGGPRNSDRVVRYNL